MKKNKALLLITAMLVGGVALAVEQMVNQGSPGNRGPWPVSTVLVYSSSSISTTPLFCNEPLNSITSVGAAAVDTPAAQLANRRYVVFCNSLQNAGNPLVKCRTDGTPPVMAAGNAGDVLATGDCILYPITASVVPSCIADAAATFVTSYECK